ncbi:aspartate/glutamate racemase family protein [Agromyces bauzanensis]
MYDITWVEATHGDERLARLWSFLTEQVGALAAGRANVRLRHVSVAAGGIRTAPNRLLSDAAILATALDEQEHADALVIGCWGAPTEVVRAAVDAPVSSLPDGSVRAVASLARRAVIVTVSPTLVPIFADDLRRLGATGFLEDRPVRAYDPESSHFDVVDAIDDPAALIARFDEVARAAVADGADAIVVGCGYLAPLFTHHGYTHVTGHPDVPVLDCNRLAFEHALGLLALDAAGIRPTARGYVRPAGERALALAAASARLTG